MVSSSSLLDDELGRARSDTPDSQATIPDPPDESYYRDFARLVPVNRQARIAFSEVAERMKVEAEWAPHAAHFVHIDAVKRSLTELTGSSETDASVDSLHDADASSSSSSAAASAAAVPPVWTGYYRLNLERPPLRPHVGWVLGSYLNNADLLLTARRQLYRVRGRHARLAFNLQSYSLLAFADFGHAILLEGKEELRNGQRVLWAGETAISLGELSYKLVRTTVSDSTLREQLNHWRDTIGTTSLEPPAYLAPTPSPDDYEYNGYIIKAVFAQGSTCSVSAGVDKRTGAAVAVKKMIRNGRNRDMVRNEIEVLKYLANHVGVSPPPFLLPPPSLMAAADARRSRASAGSSPTSTPAATSTTLASTGSTRSTSSTRRWRTSASRT